MNLFTHLNRKMRYGSRSVYERLKFLPQRSHALSAEQTRAIHDLNTEGVHVTTIDRLFENPQSAAAYRHAAAFITDPVNRSNGLLWRQGESSRDITPAALLTHMPQVFLAGLDASMLSLVSHYLGKSVGYHGSVIRHSAVKGPTIGTRLWHQDAEDSNVFRMVVYLNDVEPGGGPFEYIPRSTGLSYRQLGSGALTNERVNAILPSNHWKQIYGPAGTVVLCDTARVFHHESVQESRARSVVMIGYSSRFPKSMELAMAHFPAEQVMNALMSILPEDRLEHAIGWRKPAMALKEQRQREQNASKATLEKAA